MLRSLLGPCLAICLVVLACLNQKVLLERLLQAVAATEALGTAGLGLYLLIYVVSTLVFVPTASLDMIAGLLFTRRYGLHIAIIVAGCSKQAAVSVHYFLGMSLFRSQAEKYMLGKFPIFNSVSKMISTQPFSMTCVVRCAPIPSMAKNMGLAVLDVPFFVFTVVSFLFSLPWTVGTVIAGSTLTSIPEILDGRGREKLDEFLRPWTKNPVSIGVVTLLCVTGFGYTFLNARRAYAEVIAQEARKED
eukprot:TRINITY_DN29792_c0_g1_i1.p1 TRINITY_DN29792_c0_g1~~TRINITY_DN29792_c0_g1_i1.p1  ORF type:complete len:247 (+),score=14.42 TRINITY_DN29792_c0_g1_i1:50-790(+)